MIINSTNILNAKAGQYEMSIFDFASMLSHLDVGGLCKRYYGGHKFESVIGNELIDFCPQRKMTWIYKELIKLEEVNELFEYGISITNPLDIDDWNSITFTKQGNKIVLEVY